MENPEQNLVLLAVEQHTKTVDGKDDWNEKEELAESDKTKLSSGIRC